MKLPVNSNLNKNKPSGSSGIKLFILGLFMAFMLNAGCGGGGSSSGGVTPTPTPVNDPVTEVNSGTSAMKSGDLTSAQTHFTNVINNGSATTEQKMTAYAGIGWISLKSGAAYYDPSTFTNAIQNAETNQALKSTEAYVQSCVGRSIAYASNLTANVSNALSDLTLAGFSDATKTYTNNSLETGVTNGEVRGYKSFLHYFRNQSGDTDSGLANFKLLETQNASALETDNSKLMENTLKALFVNY